MKRKTSKVISIVLTLCMILSCLAITGFTVNAKDTDKASVASEAKIQSNVQDGVILHAFNWSYNTIKENLPAIVAAGYSTVQTSPVQQPKDYGDWYKVADQWSKLYQPLSFSIAKDTWLGTKEELASLCDEAHKYGVKIICDVVTNHLANNMSKDNDNANVGVLYSGIADIEPEIYNDQSNSLHSYNRSTSDSSVQAVVQGYLSNCPDLNTGSELIQNRVISLLEECVDCGVDGFRFDAAKHIETPSDGSYASNYWPNVTSTVSQYAKDKYQKTEYYYGEILNTCGSGRNINAYTPYINVTDNAPGNNTRNAIKSGNASTASRQANANSIGAASKNSVLWAESHDTYMDGSSATVSDEDIIKTWALVAAQSDATSLFFARPGDALMGQAAGNTSWKSITVSEVNKFHNAFVGTTDKTSYSGTIAYVARGDKGIVLVNCNGTTSDVNIADTGLADGTYTDTITGNKFTVSGGVVTGKIGDTGVAVVYDSTTTPTNTNSVESCTFKGETLNVTLGLVNATSGTYQIDNAAPVTYTDTTEVTLGSGVAYNSTITLKLTATDGNQTTTAEYKYVKTAPEGTGVYIVLDEIRGWSAPFYAYVYDEITDPDNTITNAAWPGEKMEYDEATGYYYYEVPQAFVDSPNTQVVLNNNNGGQQYPAYGNRTKLNLEGKSHLLHGTSWTVTDFKPTKETTPTETEPTDTTPTETEPTDTTPTETEPTDTTPTETEPTDTTPTDTEPTDTTPTDPVPTYYVAGDFFENTWKENENPMTPGNYEFDGQTYDYALTVPDVASGSWAFKITDGHWNTPDETFHEISNNGQNFTFVLTDACDVTIYLNSESKTVVVDAEFLGKFELEYIMAVGNGDGPWLNGKAWDLTAQENMMTEISRGVWSITYEGIEQFNDYQVKFACNGSWTPYNWTSDGILDGQENPSILVPFNNATVTLTIDVNGFDFETGEGSVDIDINVKNAEGFELGDVNKDGVVNVVDATILQINLAKLTVNSVYDETLADYNRDGFVNVLDVTYIQLATAGLLK